MHSSQSQSQKSGAHTVFKEGLKVELHSRVGATVKLRAGPSWDERMEKAVKGFQAKTRVSEGESKKTLSDAIEKGRSRATSAPIRSADQTPNSTAMLAARKKKMHDQETEYREQLDALRDKMEKREPLFRLAEVRDAFAMQRNRMEERKRQMVLDEHERWESLRLIEESAASRPLLIEDAHFKAPKKAPPAGSASAPDLKQDSTASRMPLNPAVFGGREEYAKDKKIREAVNAKWYQQTSWAKEVAAIRDRADNRKKLHEEMYHNKGDAHAMTRNRLMHALPAQVPGVY